MGAATSSKSAKTWEAPKGGAGLLGIGAAPRPAGLWASSLESFPASPRRDLGGWGQGAGSHSARGKGEFFQNETASPSVRGGR